MLDIKEKIRSNKEFAVFIILTYIDKFLVFLLPLSVIYITKDKQCYNDIEYIYSLAGVISPFFVFFSAYAFYGYKLALEEADNKYVNSFKSFSSWLIILLTLAGSIAASISAVIVPSLTLMMAFLVLVRFLYLQTINNNNAYYRLIDKPSSFVLYTIICSIASAAMVFVFNFSSVWVVIVFFLPQLVLSLGDAIYNVLSLSISWKNFFRYLVESFRYAWPVVINCTLVAFVMNYGKIYAYNNLSSYDMYNFSYILRISLVIQMAHSSLMAFFGKDLFVSGYSSSFYKKYSLIIMAAFAISILCLYCFNLFLSERLTIDITTYLVLIYTLLISYAASFEVYFARNNKNKTVLLISIVSSLIFCALVFVVGKGSLQSLAICMVIYSIVYLILMYSIAKKNKYLRQGIIR